MANRYSVPLEYLVNLNSHLNFEFEGKIKFIAITYIRLVYFFAKNKHSSLFVSGVIGDEFYDVDTQRRTGDFRQLGTVFGESVGASKDRPSVRKTSFKHFQQSFFWHCRGPKALHHTALQIFMSMLRCTKLWRLIKALLS
jgi:hypothetical protein